jgi:hypothetical protein
VRISTSFHNLYVPSRAVDASVFKDTPHVRSNFISILGRLPYDRAGGG